MGTFFWTQFRYIVCYVFKGKLLFSGPPPSLCSYIIDNLNFQEFFGIWFDFKKVQEMSTCIFLLLFKYKYKCISWNSFQKQIAKHLPVSFAYYIFIAINVNTTQLPYLSYLYLYQKRALGKIKVTSEKCVWSFSQHFWTWEFPYLAMI